MGRIGLGKGARVAAWAIGVLMCTGVASASAATLTVNTTLDEMTSGDGLCSLREAISAVNSPGTKTECGTAGGGANTVVLGAHTYPLTLAVSLPSKGTPAPGCTSGAEHSDDNTTGDLTVFGTVRDLTIEGVGTTATVINACKLGDRALSIQTGASVTVRDLTIENGRSPHGKGGLSVRLNGESGDPGGSGENGGGVLNAGLLTLTAVTVTGNEAGQGGGGGAGRAGTGTRAGGSGGDGGAGGLGGGIFNDSTGSLTLIDSTVSGDTTGAGGNGGGAGKSDQSNGGNGGNGGAGGNGGGVESLGQLTVIDSTISANTAGAGGVAAAGKDGGSGGTGGSGGSGGDGGAGGGVSAEGGSVSIANSTIEGNLAGTGSLGEPGGSGTTGGVGGNGGNGGGGGGLLLAAPTASTVLNGTVADNAVGSGERAASDGSPAPSGAGTNGTNGVGGGAFVEPAGPTTFKNTLLASNGSVGNCATTAMTPIASVLIDGGHNIGYTPPPGSPLAANQLCPAAFGHGNPALGPLQNNLGPTLTMALGAGSAAVNQIPPGADCPATDQRGFKRPSGPACDIGAYEVTPPAVSPAGATSITDKTATIHGDVTANQVKATVRFQFGRTVGYGSQTVLKTVGGVSAVAIVARLTGLRPGTKYHYRVVASSSDGASKSADAMFTTKALPPAISALKIKPGQFKPGRSGGATLSYSDSAAARTTFVVFSVQRGTEHMGKCVKAGKSNPRRACQRLVQVGTLVHTDKPGKNSLRFAGVLGQHALAPGGYRIEATPRFNGLSGKTVSVEFKIT